MCEENMKDGSREHDKHCCCCFGPQGPQGVQGMQGSQGLQGVAGQDGKTGPQGPQGVQGTSGADGQNGSQGPQGLPGDQGPQGLQGVPGKDCECGEHRCCCEKFCNVYSSLPQSIGPYSSLSDTVTFDKQNAVSLGDFDLSQVSTSGDIKFLHHGIYRMSWLLQGRIQPPIPQPVPSWSFGFWINGVLVAGSIYSGFTQSPNDSVVPSSGEIEIEVQAGDVLRLRNTCVSTVDLNPNVTGSVFPITVASVNISCLKKLF